MEKIRNDSIDEIRFKLTQMNTAFNKISYLEKVLKEQNFSIETKRFIYSEIANYYSEMKMYQKAARAINCKASIEISKKDKVNSFITAAEYYARLCDIENSESMFLCANREATPDLKVGIILAKKNIYTQFAEQLDKQGKRRTALKFYEQLYKMDIDPSEKLVIRDKLKKYYDSLGMFRESKMLN